MKIALIDNLNVLQTWNGGPEIAIRYELPNGTQLSPVYVGWEDDNYKVVQIEEFVIPGGKRTTGQPSYTLENGIVTESYDTEDIPTERPMVRKSTVQARLIEAGKMNAAYAALTSNPIYFARWFAPDRPQVYCDDPDALLLLQAIGADAQVIMAPEE